MAVPRSFPAMPPTNRLVSLDAYRGFIMLLIVSGGFGLAQMAKANPDVWWWQAIGHQVEHVAWQGCALWDLIQPAFMFMVGMAVPFSVAARRERGQGFLYMSWHALTRSVLLILLAVLLSTTNRDPQTNWVFVNVLAQIGLGYFFLFLLVLAGWEYCVAAIVIIMAGCTAWFLQHPLPGPGYDFAAAGASQADLLPGHWGHWSKNLNAAADFDRWFLNLFPRHEKFVSNPGGYATLNFIPALATMLGGAVTGRFLQRSSKTAWSKCGALVVAGVVCLFIGTVLGLLAVPIVKRIWTPSWIFFSGGWVLLMLAAFYWLVEIAGQRKLVFPLVVVGMNSIFVYVMYQLSAGWIRERVRVHAGADWFNHEWAPVLDKSVVVIVLWLLCFWLYRQRAFLRL